MAIYNENAFRINLRATNAGAPADDYRQWSKENFLEKIKSLTAEALESREELLATPLEAYKGVVAYSRDALTFYPTMFDFAAYQAIECLEPFTDYMGVFNPRLALAPMNMALYPVRRAGTVSPDVLEIYRSLAEGRADSAPAILARRNQIGYILPRLFAAPAEGPDSGAWGTPRKSSRDYEAYMGAYNECKSSPYAIELLLPLGGDGLTASEASELYAITGNFIKSNPAYFNINAVKNLHNALGRKNVQVTIAQQGVKGMPLKATVESRNVGNVTLNLYDVTRLAGNKREAYFKLPATLPAPVQTLKIDFDGETPFSATKEAEVTLPAYGFYVLVASFDGQQKYDKSYPLIACSDLSLGVFTGVGGAEAVAVDAMSGAPVDGVSLFFRPWSRAAANETLPGTTRNGMLAITKDRPGTVEPHLGKDVYAPNCNFYNVNEAKLRKSLRGEIFTALSLYHPGDKVDFSIVVYESDNGKNTIASGRALKAVLRDANYQPVDTVALTTDGWGRAESSFTLPSDGLTGKFTIELTDGENTAASTRFNVSDYKLPTFAVEVTGIERPATLGDPARIAGEAMTFAGFPVEEAVVKLQLSVIYGSWFWSATSPVFYSTETKSDAKGAFVVDIPAEVIASSPAPEGYFKATVAVTSADGETHEATAGFNMGKPLSISAALPRVFNPASADKMPVSVTDSEGKSRDVELGYEIKSIHTPLYGGDTEYRDVKSGTMRPGDFSPVLASLPSGEYTVRFTTTDASLADAMVIDRVVVFRPSDGVCPVSSLLWLPETTVTADERGVAEITYGTALENARVFMIVSDNSGAIVEKRWLTPSKGIDKTSVRLPSADNQARVYLHVVSRMHSEAASVDVMPLSSRRAIKIETETFRDKVTPGNRETLKFKVSGAQGALPESAVVLDMSNKAIDVLSPNPLNFVPAGYWGRGLSADGLYFGKVGMSFAGIFQRLKAEGVSIPQFEFYGRSFFPELMVVREHKMQVDVTIRGANRMMSAAGASTAQKEEAAEEDVFMAESSVAMDADGGYNAANGADAQAENVYRPSEMPLAFFRPMLQTDAEGNLEVTYEVPDANTTWILRALAYNRELLTASDAVQIVASKPLMVSCNAPRFLRTGDRVKLQASVMNAADSAVVATSLCEIIDMATGEVVASKQCADTIGAMGRKVVAIDFDVPAGVQGVIYRVKGTAGTFTDGEQSLIPVLPSEQDVVESQMFYLAPGQTEFSMPIDAVDNGRAYLKFTENPAWEVVSALPGLRESQINSSLEAASAIFSAAVADGLMREYPEIARTLRKWRDNPSDSTLVSQLEKNEELKSILLNSTPWVADALSQTERMQRLVLLLDSRNTSQVIGKG
ncbi:MAG: hypothetical protein K2L78_01505, partial [Muribaculaceae bacterium]|nr:hypothetical protein [Muribaculaceae bacterium]